MAPWWPGTATVIGSAKVPVPPACWCSTGSPTTDDPGGVLSCQEYPVSQMLSCLAAGGVTAGAGAGAAGARAGGAGAPQAASDTRTAASPTPQRADGPGRRAADLQDCGTEFTLQARRREGGREGGVSRDSHVGHS